MAYEPTFYGNTLQAFGFQLSRFSGERANDCNCVAHREPWGVKKLTATTILRLYQKLKKRKISKKTISW